MSKSYFLTPTREIILLYYISTNIDNIQLSYVHIKTMDKIQS